MLGGLSESCEEEEVNDCNTGRTLPAAESDCGASVTAFLKCVELEHERWQNSPGASSAAHFLIIFSLTPRRHCRGRVVTGGSRHSPWAVPQPELLKMPFSVERLKAEDES